MLQRRTRTKLLLGPVAASLIAAGCGAADQRIAVGVADAAACTWLQASGGIRACAGTPGEKLAALSEMQRAEVEALARRAALVDPVAVEVALASLRGDVATLRAVTEHLLALAAKAPPATPEAPAKQPPAPEAP